MIANTRGLSPSSATLSEVRGNDPMPSCRLPSDSGEPSTFSPVNTEYKSIVVILETGVKHPHCALKRSRKTGGSNVIDTPAIKKNKIYEI